MAKKYFNLESAMLALLCVGAVVGIWHALPLVNIIADEMYYVGGVFRAFEAKSLFPLPGDVPYGTVTFYLNYLLEIPFVILLFALKGFHLAALKTFLIVHPEVAYLVPRFLSACIATAFAWFFNRWMREEEIPLPLRFAALTVLFFTILPAVIFHTGKMWVLSFALVALSMLCLYRALWGEHKRRYLWAAVILPFVAVVNFPFTLPFLVPIPILAWFYRKDRAMLKSVAWASGAGVLVFLAIFLLNASNYISLLQIVFTGYHPIVTTDTPVFQISFLESLQLHGYQLVTAYPLILLLLAFAAARGAVKNKKLFFLSGGYALLYFFSLCLLATYYNDSLEFLRYLFPFGFFFAGMAAALSYEKLRVPVVGFVLVQIGVYLYLLFLLCTPTTYNLARDYVVKNFASDHALIYDDFYKVELPLNQASALLTKDEFCGSKCQYFKSASNSDFSPTVLTAMESNFAQASSTYEKYIFIGDATSSPCILKPLAHFSSGSSKVYVSVEYAIGNYFTYDFWHLSRLGQDVYIYEVKANCSLYAGG